LNVAKSIVTVSEFSRADIAKKYNIELSRITVIPNAARAVFQPLTIEEKDAVKEKYTDGREYFIYAGSIHPRKNLKNLLKGFSLFKRRQKSNWKLVLAGRLAWMYEDFIRDLKTYKYRDDVILTGYLEEEELARLVASAYSIVYPSVFEGFGMPVAEAMQCGVPVITSANSAMAEVAGNAALYADPADHNDIGEKMMTMYKDEQLRHKLVDEGMKRAVQFDWDISSKKLWDQILLVNKQ
jgi:glycosyltransferase involved in cell wall biosynthesis